MLRSLQRDGYHGLMGQPCGYKLSGMQTRFSLWNATSGGLATIASNQQPIQKIVCANSAFQSGRCTLTWIPTGVSHRGIYIFNVYGHVGAGPKNPKAYESNEELLVAIASTLSSLGEVPILWVGGFQIAPEHSHTLGTLIRSNQLFDLGAIYTNSTWTYQKGSNQHIRTRIDLALCNHAMLPLIRHVTVLRDSGLPGHCPLSVSLNLARCQDSMFVYRAPKTFEFSDSLTNEDLAALDNEVWSENLDNFIQDYHTCLRVANEHGEDDSRFAIIDRMFHQWSSTAELFLTKCGKNPTTRAHTGRGLQPRIVKQKIHAAPLNKEFGAANLRLLALLKMQRRLQQLLRKLESDQVGVESQNQRQNLIVNIQRNWRLLHVPNLTFV